MNRKEFERIRKKEIGGIHLSEEERVIYLNRLMKPYGEKGRRFIFQYLDADGNELSGKFWSVNSSSRFAFELYSWMAECSDIKNIEFEKKLVGIKNAGKVPNMDVYIEIGNRVIFIESKFSEIYKQQIIKLPDAYYKEDGFDTSGRPLKSSLESRYYDLKQVASMFNSFINSVYEKLENKDYEDCWMEFKQEITHLVGIALTICLDETGFYKDKDIEFYNIYYDFHDKGNSAIDFFFDEAKEKMSEILKGYCNSFTYSHMKAQQMVRENIVTKYDLSKQGFSSDKTIGQILSEQFRFEI